MQKIKQTKAEIAVELADNALQKLDKDLNRLNQRLRNNTIADIRKEIGPIRKAAVGMLDKGQPLPDKVEEFHTQVNELIEKNNERSKKVFSKDQKAIFESINRELIGIKRIVTRGGMPEKAKGAGKTKDTPAKDGKAADVASTSLSAAAEETDAQKTADAAVKDLEGLKENKSAFITKHAPLNKAVNQAFEAAKTMAKDGKADAAKAKEFHTKMEDGVKALTMYLHTPKDSPIGVNNPVLKTRDGRPTEELKNVLQTHNALLEIQAKVNANPALRKEGVLENDATKAQTAMAAEALQSIVTLRDSSGAILDKHAPMLRAMSDAEINAKTMVVGGKLNIDAVRKFHIAITGAQQGVNKYIENPRNKTAPDRSKVFEFGKVLKAIGDKISKVDGLSQLSGLDDTLRAMRDNGELPAFAVAEVETSAAPQLYAAKRPTLQEQNGVTGPGGSGRGAA